MTFFVEITRRVFLFVNKQLSYRRLHNINPLNIMSRNCKRWTEEEDERLLQQVRTFPQNLTKCFFIVSEVLDRSPSAVSARWYTVLSKRPDVMCFFTASSKHVCKNRKNGMGVESTRSIWRRLIAIIRNL